tara:strand:- start:2876 stop:3430 length:555 start_codon:yes stop_codon:yes gene_type:complete
MIRKIFSETIFYTGEVGPTDLFKIDRQELLFNIAESYYLKKYHNNTELLKIVNIRSLTQLAHWWYDARAFDLHKRNLQSPNLVVQDTYALHILPGDQSQKRNHNHINDDKLSPDYTFIYCVDVQKDSSQLIIDFDDHRRKNRTWTINLENNYFYCFPSSLNYYITKNTSERINTLLIQTYEEIR